MANNNSTTGGPVDEDSIPLSQLRASAKKRPTDDDDDVPLSKLKKDIKKEDVDDDDVPLSKLKRGTQSGGKAEVKSETPKDSKESNKRKSMDNKGTSSSEKDKAKPKKVKREKDSDDDEYASDHKSKKKDIKKEKGKDKAIKTEKKSGKDEKSDKKDKKSKKGEKDEPEVWEWWKEEKALPPGKKWRTLAHNGPLFAEEYKPHNVKLLYDGKAVDLSAQAEEAATFYAKYLETDYIKQPKFRENYWSDFKKLLTKDQRKTMTNFDKFDFRHIHAHLLAEKEKKKEDKERKQREKETKEKLADYHGKAIIDGHEVKISNWLIEPPGLFLGRGEHPKRGMLKTRVQPEDVTINIGKSAPIPKAPEGHKWKEVVHDDTVAWIATWKENVTGQPKYVKLHASSHISGKSDMKKYELSRQLKNKIDKIRKAYRADMTSDLAEERQRAVAIYFIDKLALRVGNEKGEDEADTVGCCSLRVEHIQLLSNNRVSLNFLGKDSMEYKNEFDVEPAAYKALEGFVYKNSHSKERKKGSEPLFDKLSTTSLNKYLKGQVENLSAKVFRTYNASITLERELAKMPESLKNATPNEKIAFYNACNRAVAILCNHKKTVSKSFGESMAKIEAKIKGFEKQKKKLKQQFKFLKGKGPKPEMSDSEEEETTTKSPAKDKSKDSKGKKKKDDDENDFEDTPKKKKQTLPDDTDKVKKAIEKVEQSILKWTLQKEDREGNKEVALGTSKINYMDPRITAAWCKKVGLPVEKIFNKTLLAKFPWAMDPGEDWKY